MCTFCDIVCMQQTGNISRAGGCGPCDACEGACHKGTRRRSWHMLRGGQGTVGRALLWVPGWGDSRQGWGCYGGG